MTREGLIGQSMWIETTYNDTYVWNCHEETCSIFAGFSRKVEWILWNGVEAEDMISGDQQSWTLLLDKIESSTPLSSEWMNKWMNK